MFEQGTRRRHAGLTTIVASVALLCAAALAAAPAGAQSTSLATCPPGSLTSGATVGSVDLAQTFTVASDATAESIQLDLGNPFPATTTGDFVVQLFLADATGPTGAALATGTIPVGDIPGAAPTRVTITLSPTPVLIAGQQYAFVVTKPGSGDAAVSVNDEDPCPGQHFYRAGGSSDPWTPSPTQDLIFTLLGSPPPTPDPESQPQPAPKADGTLTIDANKGKVEKGRKVTLTGQLDVAANESCEPGRQIQIQRRLKSEDDSKFATFATLNTDATGNYTLKAKVKKTYFYRAVVAESDACDDETSNSQKVRVQKKTAAQEA